MNPPVVDVPRRQPLPPRAQDPCLPTPCPPSPTHHHTSHSIRPRPIVNSADSDRPLRLRRRIHYSGRPAGEETGLRRLPHLTRAYPGLSGPMSG